jgi:hypothetical protein
MSRTEEIKVDTSYDATTMGTRLDDFNVIKVSYEDIPGFNATAIRFKMPGQAKLGQNSWRHITPISDTVAMYFPKQQKFIMVWESANIYMPWKMAQYITYILKAIGFKGEVVDTGGGIVYKEGTDNPIYLTKDVTLYLNKAANKDTSDRDELTEEEEKLFATVQTIIKKAYNAKRIGDSLDVAAFKLAGVRMITSADYVIHHKVFMGVIKQLIEV